MMTYRDLYTRLETLYDTREAQAIVRTILEIRFEMSYTDIVCGKVNELSADKEKELEEIMRRLENSEPLQYILGEAEFAGRTFHVEPGVLIPRPETAELCRLIVDDIKAIHKDTEPIVITDVGTGSGCIAITLSLELLNSKVRAYDISTKALEIAKKNAELLGADVDFEIQDALRLEPKSVDDKFMHIIVSNPPYIAEKEKEEMCKNVLDYEPSLALFVSDEDPLIFYRSIAEYGVKNLKDGDRIYYEINPIYAQEMVELMESLGYRDIKIANDLYGKQRMLRAIHA